MTTLLSGRQDAKVIGVSYTTVQRWVKDGEMVPTARSGKATLFDPNYVRLYAEQYQLKQQTKAA